MPVGLFSLKDAQEIKRLVLGKRRRFIRRERVREPRMTGGSGVSSNGNTGGGGMFCPCYCADTGSVVTLGYEWSANYKATLGVLGEVLLTYQGEDTWESAPINYVCESGTDTYVVTMTATSLSEITLTVAVETSSYCCDFAWSYVVPYAIDPLCTMMFVRSAAGFENRDCETGPCIVCVRPADPTIVTCNDIDAYEFYRVDISSTNTCFATTTRMEHQFGGGCEWHGNNEDNPDCLGSPNVHMNITVPISGDIYVVLSFGTTREYDLLIYTGGAQIVSLLEPFTVTWNGTGPASYHGLPTTLELIPAV